MSVVNLFDNRIAQDLANSGLSVQDIRARTIGVSEKASANIPAGIEGYAIPYYDINGKPIQFYRVRLFDYEPKYKQILNAPNHLYFPPNVKPLLEKAKFVILTEGEKKAAAAVKAGFPCVALSGVDSWRNRTIIIPKDARVAQSPKGDIIARLKGPVQLHEKLDETATGLTELIDFCVGRNIPIVIIYDADTITGVAPQVQRAAAVLGFEMRFRGMPFKNIRQCFLEVDPGKFDGKVGLDDYLLHDDYGTPALAKAIKECLDLRSAFPQHPNPKEYVNRKLQKTNMTRQDIQSLATAVLCDLDSKGTRLRNPNDDSQYYFDRQSHRLLRVQFDQTMGFAKTPFAVRLYRDYNLGTADDRLMKWINTQFSGEEPIVEAYPERVVKLQGDTLYYQLNDGQTVKVTAADISVIDNGEDDILFEAGSVKGVKEVELKAALAAAKLKPLDNIWYEVLKEVRVQDSPQDFDRKILSLLYHLSPWFYRWRGTQLPVEMICGEPGSGKSTLFQLRLNIMTGDPILRNAPKDLRDWTASVAATGGMHVVDNVHMTNNAFKQELSDEYCRIVTEPNPTIERRKLYSDNELIRTPVRAVFAVTAVRQPFTNSDIIQRSIITTLDKGVDVVEYDGEWATYQLNKFGNRPGWLAHQFLFQQRMFQLIAKQWNYKYRARYRLINLEQLLCLAAEVFGWESEWIPDYLQKTRDDKTANADWALQGIQAWADSIRDRAGKQCDTMAFTARHIADWATGNEDYEKCELLINTRMLGKYLQTNKNMVAQITGVEDTGLTRNNVKVIRVRWMEPSAEELQDEARRTEELKKKLLS